MYYSCWQTGFLRLSGGVGEHTKMPTMDQLFPDPVYMDLVQLNYYHANADYRRINLMTYVIDPTNYDLKPARNLKWEMTADMTVGGYRLSVTYFRENMTSGFRSQSSYAPYTYKQYDASGVDAGALTAPPSLVDMPYTLRTDLRGYSHYTNGSQTLKRGVEYTFSTKRFERIMTRLTVNGAWFYTIYRNSMMETYKPSAVVAGKQIQYVGYYDQDGGSKNQMMNTNFTVDTDIHSVQTMVNNAILYFIFTSIRY
jgi:outer membrane receptor for ferrienterochelin and colicin